MLHTYQLETTHTETVLMIVSDKPSQGFIARASGQVDYICEEIEPSNADDISVYAHRIHLSRTHFGPGNETVTIYEEGELTPTATRELKWAPSKGAVRIGLTSNPNALRRPQPQETMESLSNPELNLDALVISGDLVEKRSNAEYLQFSARQELTERVPFIPGPGNHDTRSTKFKKPRYNEWFGPYVAVHYFGAFAFVTLDDSKKWRADDQGEIRDAILSVVTDHIVVLVTNGMNRHPTNLAFIEIFYDDIDIVIRAGGGIYHEGYEEDTGGNRTITIYTGGGHYLFHTIEYDGETLLIQQYGRDGEPDGSERVYPARDVDPYYENELDPDPDDPDPDPDTGGDGQPYPDELPDLVPPPGLVEVRSVLMFYQSDNGPQVAVNAPGLISYRPEEKE